MSGWTLRLVAAVLAGLGLALLGACQNAPVGAKGKTTTIGDTTITTSGQVRVEAGYVN